MAKSGLKIDRHQYDALIKKIYHCAVQPALWADVILELGQPIDCHLGQLVICTYQSCRGYTHSTHGGPEPDGLQQFSKEIAAGLNPRVNFGLKAPPMTVYTDADCIEASDMDGHYFYAEGCGKRFDAEYGALAVLDNRGEEFSVLANFRSKKQGPVEGEELKYYSRISWHVQRSIELLKWNIIENRYKGLSEGVEFADKAVFFLDRKGEVCGHNRKAEEVLAESNGIDLEGRRLVFRDQVTKRHMENAVQKALTGEFSTDVNGETTRVTLGRKPNHRPYQAIAVPVRDFGSNLAGIYGMLCLSDPGEEQIIAAQCARRLYSLTPAESRLLVGLCRGHSLESYSDRVHISIQTARSHLKSIFMKTDTNRQTELVVKAIRDIKLNQSMEQLKCGT